MIYLPGSNDLSAKQEWFICQLEMIYLPGGMILDFILFALAFHFIKKIGNIHFFGRQCLWFIIYMVATTPESSWMERIAPKA
jgi:hypothetical protein